MLQFYVCILCTPECEVLLVCSVIIRSSVLSLNGMIQLLTKWKFSFFFFSIVTQLGDEKDIP